MAEKRRNPVAEQSAAAEKCQLSILSAAGGYQFSILPTTTYHSLPIT